MGAFVYNLYSEGIFLLMNKICGLARLGAEGCETAKITFRVRCDRPCSATSPLAKLFYLRCLQNVSVFAALTGNAPVPLLASPSIPGVYQPVDADIRCWEARWRATHDHLRRLCPSSSAYCGRSTRATISLLANVCRLQCQVYPRSLPLRARLKKQPSDPCSASTLRT